MAQVALTVVGYAIGGPIGGAIGGAVGAYLDAPQPPDQTGPSFSDSRVTASAYGQAVPLVWGTMPVAGNIIDASTVDPVGSTSGGGSAKNLDGPTTPKVTTFTHYADLDILVADASIGSYTLIQIYANENLIFDATPGASVQQPDWLQFEWYDGTQTQPDPTFEAIHGAGNVPAYLGFAHIVFRRFKLDEFGLADQIAVQFKFVISLNGTEAPAEETIDTTGYEPLSTDVVGLAWAKYPDIMVVALKTSAGTSVNTHTLLGVDPYTREVVWKREPPVDRDDGRVSNMVLGGIPVYYLGQRVNPPLAQVVYALDHDATTSNFIEIADADTGVIRVSAGLPEEFPPAWMVMPYNNDMIMYRRKTGDFGAAGVVRMSWGGFDFAELSTSFPWTDANLTSPDGWTWHPGVAPVSDGAGLMCFPFEETVPDEPGVVIISDENFRTAADPTLVAYTPTVIPGIDEIISLHYDETQDCFWTLGDRSADTNTELTRIERDATIGGSWNLATDLGITGSLSLSELQPDIDTAAGRIVFGLGSNIYTISTANPEINIRTYAKPSSLVNGGVMHPLTGRWYSRSDEILKIIQLRSATLGTTDLQTVCEDISLWPDTGVITLSPQNLIKASDVSYTALSSIAVKGFLVGRNMSRAAALNQLMSIYLFDTVPRSGVLTAVLRGAGSSVVTLDDDTIGAYVSGGTPPTPLEIVRQAPESLPRKFSLRYINPDQNWEQGSQTAQRLATPAGVGTTENLDVAVSLTDVEGAQAADVLLHMRHIEGERYNTRTMPSTIGDVAPANIVTVEHGAATYIARVDSADIIDGMMVDARLVRSDTSIYTSYAVGGVVRNTGKTVYATGSALIVPMQLPALRTEDFEAGYYAAVYSHTPNWPGAQVFRSVDDSIYDPVANTPRSATVGVIAAIDGPLLAHRWVGDLSMQINVITGEDLASESLSDVEASETLNAVALGRDGRWVVGRYLSAAQNADESWTIDGLVLGLGGTEQNVSKLVANDRFIPLNTDDIRRIPLNTSAIGGSDFLKPVTLGRSLEDVIATRIAPTGEALRPYAPYGMHASGFGGDLTLSCVRRDKQRPRGFWQAGMSETSESYKWQILDSSAVVVRTLTSSTESVTYTSAQQIADFGSTRDFIRFKVAQVSSETGDGWFSYSESGSKVAWENFILEFSPIAFIRFEDAIGSATLLDSSGNGHDLTNPDDESLLRQPGPFGFGIDMSADGSAGEVLDFGTVTELNEANDNDMSLVVWFEAKAGFDANTLGSFINQSSGFDVQIINDSGLRLTTIVRYSSTSARFYTSDLAIVAGTKHLLVVTHDSSARTSKIYFDGTEVSSYSTSTTGVGTPVNGNSFTQIGDLDSRRIILYEWALIPSELSSSDVSAAYSKLTE